jgi:hypothetical protein
MRALQEGSGSEATTEANVTASSAPAEERRGLPKVRSGINIANIYVEAQEGPIQQKEQTFKSQLPAE